MTLPALTKFPYSSPTSNIGDCLCVSWDIGDNVYLTCYERKVEACSALDREQVESLRDQLTQWLEIHP